MCQRSLLAFTLLFLLLSCSRSPSPLEQAALQIKPEMTVQDVKQLFSSFRVLAETNVSGSLPSTARPCSTNRQFSSKVMYAPKQLFSFEHLTVYFETNGNVIGWNYNPPG